MISFPTDVESGDQPLAQADALREVEMGPVNGEAGETSKVILSSVYVFVTSHCVPALSS